MSSQLPKDVLFSQSSELYHDPTASNLNNPLTANTTTINASTNVANSPSILGVSQTANAEGFLTSELRATTLDSLAPHLYVLCLHKSEQIDPLHLQILKGRKIVITEEPRLHLVWFYDTIYIKPFPEYLGNHAFWQWFTDRHKPLEPSALGFVRTYARLIKHQSDFQIAIENNLFPSGPDKQALTWQKFSEFISAFRGVPDSKVSPRYTYGQLRLTRLNWAMRLCLGGKWAWYYQRLGWQTGDYITRHFNSLLFTFAAVALVLGAMQVALAAREFHDPDPSWNRFARFSWGFSVFTCVLILAILFVTIVMTVGYWVNQMLYGYRYEQENHPKQNQQPSATP